MQNHAGDGESDSRVHPHRHARDAGKLCGVRHKADAYGRDPGTCEPAEAGSDCRACPCHRKIGGGKQENCQKIDRREEICVSEKVDDRENSGGRQEINGEEIDRREKDFRHENRSSA